MNKVIVPMEMPKTCCECIFCGDRQDIALGHGIYEKIARCRLSPEDVEDPWRNIHWQTQNKERWCPLVEYVDNRE